MYRIVFACILFVMIGVVFGGDLLDVNTYPQWDLCVNGGDLFSCSGHGSCSGGECVCVDGYSGRDCSIPSGGFTYSRPTATATYFCTLASGGCAPGMCIGGGDFTAANLPDGIDGICALNPTLYGSRYAYASGQSAIPRTVNGQYTYVGQSCGTCWRLTRANVSVTVTVVDRCAGYCRANTQGVCDPNAFDVQESECGNCINGGHASVPVCSCYSPNATTASPKGFCDSNTAINCDWCSNNDHPHFDLDDITFNTLCGEAGAAGHCDLDSFQMIDCGLFKGPWPNGYYNGTAAPSSVSSVTSSSSISSSGSSDTGGDSGICTSANEGDFMCNGCDLMRCANGVLVSYGNCTGGLVCHAGNCNWGTQCDAVWNNTITNPLTLSGSGSTGNTANTGSTGTTIGNERIGNGSTGGKISLNSIISMWYCADDECNWASEPNLTNAAWMINRGDGFPTANVVTFAFVDPLKLLQQTTDSGYNSGVPLGFTQNVVNYFQNQGVTVLFSIGGETFTDNWNQALSQDPATLATYAASLATTYGVGIEIDYEYDSDDYATQMATFVDTYRTIIPYDPDFSGPSLLTIDTGAGTSYLSAISSWATTWIQQNKTNWINAMVSSGPWDTISDASQYWEQHITEGVPSTQMVVSHYSTDGSTLCSTYDGLLEQTIQWIETNDVRGVAFWAVGSGEATNCVGIETASEAYLNWTALNSSSTTGSSNSGTTGTTGFKAGTTGSSNIGSQSTSGSLTGTTGTTGITTGTTGLRGTTGTTGTTGFKAGTTGGSNVGSQSTSGSSAGKTGTTGITATTTGLGGTTGKTGTTGITTGTTGLRGTTGGVTPSITGSGEKTNETSQTFVSPFVFLLVIFTLFF